MGPEDGWKDIDSTTFRAEKDHPGGDSGEGDSCGVPVPERSARGPRPTLVIEAEHSQTLDSL